jgi:hypothetical protein
VNQRASHFSDFRDAEHECIGPFLLAVWVFSMRRLRRFSNDMAHARCVRPL